jgi:uncharacterized protein
MRALSFIGRREELAALRRELERDRPSVVTVFGRRRVGKSRLLMEATRETPTIYYQATRVADSLSVELFKDQVGSVVERDPVLDGLSDWLGVLSYLEGAAAGRVPGLTVVLDEFPYLCDSNPALPSLVQKFCDGLRERGTRMNLVLCGSRVSFMEELLGERNPLHGRQTLQLDVGPLPFRDASRFFPAWPPEERLRAYGVFGGMPHYLSLCDPEGSLESNVRELVLATGAPLADEPMNLLQAELRDVTRYATILGAIADGCTVSGEIIGRVREIGSSSGLAPYIQKLEKLRLIRIVRSLDASPKERNRRYYLDDPFLAFWYRFVLPNASALSAGHDRDVWLHAVRPYQDRYMGGLFEWICRDYVRLYAPERLPAAAREVGQVWGDDFDIDVAGTLLDAHTFSGECKWWDGPVGANVIERLRETTAAAAYYRGRAPDTHVFLLFSRSGFTNEVEEIARTDPMNLLFTPETLLGEA